MSYVDHKQKDFNSGSEEVSNQSDFQEGGTGAGHPTESLENSGSDVDSTLPHKRANCSDSEDDILTKRQKGEEGLLRPQKLVLKPSLAELQTSQTNLLEKLKYIRESFGNRLNPIEEPPRNQCTMDYLLSEMEWMAQDFTKEKKLKIAYAKKLVKSTQALFEQTTEKTIEEERALEEMRYKGARRVSRLIQSYWRKIAKLGEHFRYLHTEEQKREFRNKRLENMVEKQLELSKIVANRIRKEYGDINLYLRRKGDLWTMCSNEEVEELEERYTGAIPQRSMRVPFLIRNELREYQKIGLYWLVTIHDKKMNGILADEMGLGKTIQTISLLAYLAAERRIWGPHLIVVPTSIILNWEMELKRWCPALKVLTYYGNQKERKAKRVGWTRMNAFHVCITSYQLVVQDQFVFKRKRWYYLILDEAQHIKNFHSQRWQVLLGFRSVKRLMLTGTPLQNDVMELWSLLHFLMPKLFYSHEDFHAWFSSPFSNAIQQNTEFSAPIISRLQSVLRPFLLRRMKKDVEAQLPSKTEHIVFCDLSRRQQFLYDEYIEKRFSRNSDSVGIMNILMQLRKVCNHPDLFAPKTVQSPYYLEPLRYSIHPSFFIEEDFLKLDFSRLSLDSRLKKVKEDELVHITSLPSVGLDYYFPSVDTDKVYAFSKRHVNLVRILSIFHVMKLMSSKSRRKCTIEKYQCDQHYIISEDFLQSFPQRMSELDLILAKYKVIQPKILTESPMLNLSKNNFQYFQISRLEQYLYTNLKPCFSPLFSLQSKEHLLFPDRMALEHDCGKLRKLALLLRELHNGGHKCLIFTQMTKMIDILEKFLNLHGYTYVRLDGGTKVDLRQLAVDRFNLDPKIFCFLSSTRSGGLGLNLTAADTVIFYDTDWNPAMDKQAQDRCHRIGQTQSVHIYRLISSYTIEENILQKTLQKRHLDSLIMEGGQFTTEHLKQQKIHVRDFFEKLSSESLEETCRMVEDTEDVKAAFKARQEEMMDEKEFEDEGKEQLLSQVDPLTKLSLDFYLTEHPVKIVEEQEDIQVCSESSDSESEAFKVAPVDNSMDIFSNYMDFLKSKYIVY